MKWKCINCNKIREDYPNIAKKRKYCSTRCQMFYEYQRGIRDKFKITKKANEKVRKCGQPKLIGRKHTEDHKRKIREGCKEINKGKRNGMFNKKPWNKLRLSKKWWEENEFKRLRKKCLKRDHYACMKCGTKEKSLYCDHIIPYRICKNHNLKNLQTL